jgi:hypothetical protein
MSCSALHVAPQRARSRRRVGTRARAALLVERAELLRCSALCVRCVSCRPFGERRWSTTRTVTWAAARRRRRAPRSASARCARLEGCGAARARSVRALLARCHADVCAAPRLRRRSRRRRARTSTSRTPHAPRAAAARAAAPARSSGGARAPARRGGSAPAPTATATATRASGGTQICPARAPPPRKARHALQCASATLRLLTPPRCRRSRAVDAAPLRAQLERRRRRVRAHPCCVAPPPDTHHAPCIALIAPLFCCSFRSLGA